MEVFANEPAVQEKTTERGVWYQLKNYQNSGQGSLAVSRHQSFQPVWFGEDKTLQGESGKCVPHGD